MKTMDLKVRPIHHHLEGRVRAHIFLCMLAYYVEWHMRQAWRELMFTDEDHKALWSSSVNINSRHACRICHST